MTETKSVGTWRTAVTGTHGRDPDRDSGRDFGRDPVTGAAPPDHRIPWSRELTAERYPLPLSPLGWSNLSAVFDRGVRAFGEFMGMEIPAKDQLATTINGWVVANPAAFDFRSRFKIRLRRPDQIAVVKAALSAIWHSPHPMSGLKEIATLVRKPETSPTKLGARLESPTVRLVGESILRYLKPLAEGIRRQWPETVARFRTEIESVDRLLPEATTHGDVLALADRLQAAMIAYVEPDLVIFAIREIASLFLVELATLAGMPDPKRVPLLLGGALEENITLATHRRFLELGNRLGAGRWKGRSGAALFAGLSVQARADLEAFLHEAGHLTSSWDIRHPTWGEDPARFCEILAAAFSAASPAVSRERSSSSADAPETVATARERRDTMDLFERRLAENPFALEMMRELSRVLREFLVIDEEHHFHTGRIIPVTRRVVMRLGDFLSERKRVQDAVDLFWLTDEEVRQLLVDQAVIEDAETSRIASLIRDRRTAWERACRDGWPPPAGPEQAVPEEGSAGDGIQPPPAANGVWRGLPVSPGLARGPVRRVAGLADLEAVQTGDVLLVRSPDPFFVVLYPRLAAMIAETGALLSHGAIAARESALPAVFGVKGAWRSFEDGCMVEVDGSRGDVRRVD